MLDKDAHEVLVLAHIRPVVFLGDAPVFARAQTELEVDLALDVGAGGATLQAVPLVSPGRRDVLLLWAERRKKASEQRGPRADVSLKAGVGSRTF